MTNPLRAVELIKLIASDAALRERLEAADAAQRSEIIKSLGYGDLTQADVTAGSAIFANEATGELNDFELEAVAGGGTETTTSIIPTIGAAMGVAAAL
jgi:predicted ribosomally synthesized peptide with nif11-like leader